LIVTQQTAEHLLADIHKAYCGKRTQFHISRILLCDSCLGRIVCDACQHKGNRCIAFISA